MRACHGRLVLGSRPTAPSFLSKSHSRLASTAVALAPPASTPPAVRDSSPLPTAANSKSPLERELDTYLAMDSATRKATYSRDRLRHLLRRMFDASRGKRIAPAPEAVLCVFRDLQHALGSIHESSIEDYNAVLHFLVRYRRPAADLLKIMASVQQLSAAGAPIALDGETIYQLVCGLVNTGNLSKAHDVLEFAHDKSIDVGVHTYSILVKGFLKRGVYALEAMPADLRQASTRTQVCISE